MGDALDVESAKIILEHYYDDNPQRYCNRRNNSDDDDDDDHTNNREWDGELVVIPDADVVNGLTREYEETLRRERQRIVEEGIRRESRTKWRKAAIEEDRLREAAALARNEAAATIDGDDDETSIERKKKKKKKK